MVAKTTQIRTFSFAMVIMALLPPAKSGWFIEQKSMKSTDKQAAPAWSELTEAERERWSWLARIEEYSDGVDARLRERSVKGKEDDALPFAELAQTLTAKVLSGFDPEAAERERKERSVALARHGTRAAENIHLSTFIPRYCHVPVGYKPARTHDAEEDSICGRALRAVSEGENVVLMGKPGVGKTYAAIQSLYHWCRLRLRYGYNAQGTIETLNFTERRPIKDYPLFLPVADMLLNIRRCFDYGKSETELLESYQRHSLLVLDDLGAENMTEWTRSVLYEMIDRRIRLGRQFIVTTNLSLEEIAIRIDTRLASRLAGFCVALNAAGEDRRMRRIA